MNKWRAHTAKPQAIGNFGTILAKHRSRLAPRHIHAENITHESGSDGNGTSLPLPQVLNAHPLPPTSSEFPNTCLLPSTLSGTLNQLEKTEDTPTVIGSAEQPRDDESDDPDSFESIARNLEEQSQLDDARGSQDCTPPFRLEALFDFSNMTWLEMISRSMKSLHDKLELYELVDMDAEGEANDGDIVNDSMFSRYLVWFLQSSMRLLKDRQPIIQLLTTATGNAIRRSWICGFPRGGFRQRWEEITMKQCGLILLASRL
ncbi:hypothetical protein JVT61DRAFT_6619 [Boletus reticuloceps]|uniref:Uncharacterized protein n=1 Tax=Boletus reticuloceps TaxID=495285 RepID=A0A8I2YK79_9AGAM|nr:hypothetical protein JVT61DRAFT_6619 [Boletus reticuloceps]